jgi:propanediol utilization protein
MFQLRDRNVESLSTTALNGNYSIHPELYSYSAIDGNATSSASTATNLMVRDIKSFYRSSNATYLVFTITGNATSAKIKATTRLALSSGNFSASGTWSASQWIMMNGTTVSLTTNETNATSFFMADATKLINFGVNAGSDFNPGSTSWQTNTFAPFPSIPAAPGAFLSSPLLTSHIAKLDPYYSKQLISGNNSSANATIAASSALDTIITTLTAEGASLRYDKSVYLAFRENALSHLFASQDLYNSQVGERTVAHVYFTNATDANDVHHPYMVVASHNATPRPNFLVDVARPPGDGTGAYQNSTITRTAVIEYKVVLIPLKNYGLVGNFTENTLTVSLASDAGLLSANYTVENYADIASMGVAIDGVVIYPAINNTLLYATAAAEITSSGAHVGQGGALHYHADGHGFNGNGINLYNLGDYTNSSNGTSRSHPPIIGFGYDGIALYGKYESSFSAMDGYGVALDAHGGHTHGDYGYHYHAYSAPIVGLRDTAGSKSLIGTGNFTQHYLMVGAWKGSINSLPALGLGVIDNSTTGRYVGKNGTADSKPVVLPLTITGIVGNALITNITATNSPISYALASGSWPAGLSLNSTTGVINGTPSVIANGTVLVVRATNASGNRTGNVTINISKGSQTISGVATTLSKEAGSASYSLNATVSSNLTLSYTSSNTSVATVAANGTVTVAGAGTTTLTVSQAGDANYNAATSVTQALTVTQSVAAPVVTSSTINGTVGNSLSANITATNSPTGYALASGSWPAGLSLDPDTGVISGIPTAAGNGAVVVVRASNTTGNGTGSFTFNISKATPTISVVPTASAITYGQALSNATLSGGNASVVGTFAFTNPATAPLAGTSIQAVTFTPTDAANYNAVSANVSVTVGKATPVVTWSSPVGIMYGTALSGTQLNAAASENGTFSYTPASGSLPGAGNQTLAVVFTPSDTTNYNTVNSSVTLTVAKGSQTISGVATTLSKEVGSAAYSLNATVSSNLTLSYASSNTSVATVAANGTVSMLGAGTATLTVSQAGDANYNAATSVTQTLTVTQSGAAPVVTSATINGMVGISLSANITATNSPTGYALASGSWPAGLSLNSTTGVISGTPTAAGNGTVVVVRASNTTGNGTGSFTFNISKATPTISVVPTASAITYGQALSNATLSGGNASVVGTFAFTNPAMVPVAGTSLQPVTFTPTDAANYSAVSANVSVTVGKAMPVVTWSTPAAITYGAALSGAQLNAVASENGTFSYTPASGSLLGAGNQTLAVVFTPSDTTNYNTVNSSVTLTVAKGSQTIGGVATTLSKAAGSAAYSLNATVSSNLTLSYASSNTSVATVAANGTVSMLGAGTATLTVSQAGDANYNSATSVTQTLTVTQSVAAPVVTSATINGTVGISLSANITATNSPTSYALAGGSWPAGLSLNSTTGVISGTPTAAGNGTVAVVRASNTTGNGTGSFTFNIYKAKPTISVVPIASAITYGQALSNATLSGGNASVVGTFAFTSPTLVPSAGTTSRPVTFTPTDGSNYNAVSANVSVTVGKATPVVKWSNPVGITYGTALSGAQLNAVASENGTFSYTPINGTVLGAGNQTLAVVFTPSDTTNYNTVNSSVTLTVTKGSQAISGVTSTLSKEVGSAAYSLNATVSSCLAISYASSNTSVAAVAANGTVSVLRAGTATLTVSQAGDTNYNAAASVTQVLTVTAAPLKIPAVSSVSINGTVGRTLSASINATNSPASYGVISGTLPSGLSLNTKTGVISGTPTVAGNGKILVVRATNTSGNGTGNVTVNIAKGSQTISGVTSTLSKTTGSTAYSLNATASSALALSYVSSNTKVAKVATNGTVTIVGAGTTTLTVSQAGNANYNAASSVAQKLTVTPIVP